MSYRDIPALAAYIDRVGAEELNFRRFMIKDWRGGYYKQRCLITITATFDIVCTDEDYAPTEAEAAAIKAALPAVQFPHSQEATPAQVRRLREQITTPNPILFEFYNQATGNIIMLQERCVNQEGNKYFKQWSYWSDSEWRAMEPDGALPFWKPKETTNRGRIMIHEGAKAAKHVHDMLEAGDAHPWSYYLNDYEHWGMIGGALAPHRTDYAELRAANPMEVIYVCDNDWQGKEALPKVSFCWKRTLKGIYFDDKWPAGWDMADPLPKKMFDARNAYIGPPIEQLVFPATYATEKRGKETFIRQDFAQEWLHCVQPEAYIHKDSPSNVLSAEDFNNQVRPFTGVEDTARVLKRCQASKTGTIRYNPAETPGYKAGDDGAYINTHTPGRIKAVNGDASPFVEFLTHLVPDKDDRHQLSKWLATLIARPAIKMMYGVLLISERQGVGKGTLGEKIMLPLVGRHNTSVANETEIVDSAFNYWAAHKRLCVVHEIYAGHSAKAYNKLKSIITDQYIQVNKKFQAAYEIENWLHIIACSNSKRALQLSSDDRRWFVPGITDQKQPTEYWQAFNLWLQQQDGLGIIKQWADDFVLEHGHVLPGADAPAMNKAKKEMIEEAYSAGQSLVNTFLNVAKEKLNGTPVVFLDTDLQKLIVNYIHDGRHSEKLERAATLRKVAEAAGWYVHKDYCRLVGWTARDTRSKIVTNHPEMLERAPADLRDVRIDVDQKYREWFGSL